MSTHTVRPLYNNHVFFEPIFHAMLYYMFSRTTFLYRNQKIPDTRYRYKRFDCCTYL